MKTDSDLKMDVETELRWAPLNVSNRIEAALTRQAMREDRRIEILMDGSVVTLRGQVRSWAEKKGGRKRHLGTGRATCQQRVGR